jgi:hypothetical protein
MARIGTVKVPSAKAIRLRIEGARFVRTAITSLRHLKRCAAYVDCTIQLRKVLISTRGGGRGREYPRIIYGPDYTAADNLDRLRNRALGGKRSAARGEFAIGIEGLERFVRGEPLRQVHECAFAVLAMESEPVDPVCRPSRWPGEIGENDTVPHAVRHFVGAVAQLVRAADS